MKESSRLLLKRELYWTKVKEVLVLVRRKRERKDEREMQIEIDSSRRKRPQSRSFHRISELKR